MEPVVSPGDAAALRAKGIVSGYAIDNEQLPRGFGKRGGLYCPVCKQEANRQIINTEDLKMGWLHEGRAFPCVRRLGARKSQGESARPMADATDTED